MFKINKKVAVVLIVINSIQYFTAYKYKYIYTFFF